MNEFRKNILVIIFFLGLISFSCQSSDADLKLAESQVRQFRFQISQQNYDQVYEDTSTKFKEMAPKNEFLKALRSADPKISDPDKFFLVRKTVVLDINQGSVLVLDYQEKGDNNTIKEQFRFVKEGGKLALLGYICTPPKDISR